MPAAAAGEARGVGGGRAEVRFSDARVWLRRARVQFPTPPRRRTTLAARPLSGYSQGAWGGSPIRSERRAGASACAAPRRLAEGGQVPKGEVGVCDGATGGTARALRRVRPEGPHHTTRASAAPSRVAGACDPRHAVRHLGAGRGAPVCQRERVTLRS